MADAATRYRSAVFVKGSKVSPALKHAPAKADVDSRDALSWVIAARSNLTCQTQIRVQRNI
jgi:hypothetical protein